MGAEASKPDPEGMYAHATPPAGLPISVAQAEGTTVVLLFATCILSGANCALYAVYIHLFGGRRRDPCFLQLAVFLSVACNVALALVGFITYYHRSLFQLYSKQGFDTNAIEWYVPVYHTLTAVPEAIGQVYFALRIARLFDVRKISTRIGVAVAMVGIATQFVLMTWFGAAFYTVRHKSHLLEPEIRHWVRAILSAWAIIFVVVEFGMTGTTVARLIVLRRHVTMDAARRVIFNLAVYSLQGQVLLTTFSLTSFYLFSKSATGWYTPLYLMSGALYTLVLQANLIYRQAVSQAMRKAQSDYSASGGDAQREFNFNAVDTYTDGSDPIPLQSIVAQPEPTRVAIAGQVIPQPDLGDGRKVGHSSRSSRPKTTTLTDPNPTRFLHPNPHPHPFANRSTATSTPLTPVLPCAHTASLPLPPPPLTTSSPPSCSFS